MKCNQAVYAKDSTLKQQMEKDDELTFRHLELVDFYEDLFIRLSKILSADTEIANLKAENRELKAELAARDAREMFSSSSSSSSTQPFN